MLYCSENRTFVIALVYFYFDIEPVEVGLLSQGFLNSCTHFNHEHNHFKQCASVFRFSVHARTQISLILVRFID